MANQEHLELLKQAVERWNRWKREHQDARLDLSGADLSRADLSEADLSGANLKAAHLRGAYLRWANLSGADLNYVDFNYADLSGADLKAAHLIGVHLRGADLSYADLSYADLRKTHLNKANLIGATFIGANLTGANLEGAYLIRADLNGANLTGADLSGADLNHADLDHADLSGADLDHADLSHANLASADLSHADLSEADLWGAELRFTDLRGANLKGIALYDTIFAHVDLRPVRGLVEVNHKGPSVVQLHTVQLPQDGSMLHFLRGTGLPDEWIDFYRSSMMLPIQYHSCFISYSHQDETLARRLHADLQDQGVRCWFAPEDMKIGDKIRARIDEAIHLQEKLLLLLSEHSIASSWVENEVEAALEKEDRQQREVLFPIHLDDAVMQTSRAWAATLRRTRHIGDFTRWTDPQEYQRAFERLLRDLKAEAEKEHGNHQTQ